MTIARVVRTASLSLVSMLLACACDSHSTVGFTDLDLSPLDRHAPELVHRDRNVPSRFA